VEARLREASFYERGWLDRFCALVPSGGSVLDVGCGAGEPIAKYFNERGYAVTGVDSSPAMVAKFRARLPGEQALVSDMRTLSLERRFQATLAWDSFFHSFESRRSEANVPDIPGARRATRRADVHERACPWRGHWTS
ncbi:Methyltransferase type, partial [mine drainage metagenome]